MVALDDVELAAMRGDFAEATRTFDQIEQAKADKDRACQKLPRPPRMVSVGSTPHDDQPHNHEDLGGGMEEPIKERV